MSEAKYSSMWRAKARARREVEKPSLTGPVDLGDGCQFIGRRIDLSSWVIGGRVPECLTAQFVRIKNGEQKDIIADDFSAEDTLAALKFQRTVVVASVADPVIVDDKQLELADNEIRWSEIFGEYPEWVSKIYQWQLQGARGIGVQMAGGEVVELPALEKFRDGASGQTPVIGGADGEEFRDPPEPVAGNH